MTSATNHSHELDLLSHSLAITLNMMGEVIGSPSVPNDEQDKLLTLLDSARRYAKDIEDLSQDACSSRGPIEPPANSGLPDAIPGETIVLDKKRTPRFFELLEESMEEISSLQVINFEDNGIHAATTVRLFTKRLYHIGFLLHAMARNEDKEEWHRDFT